MFSFFLDPSSVAHRVHCCWKESHLSRRNRSIGRMHVSRIGIRRLGWEALSVVMVYEDFRTVNGLQQDAQ